MFNRSLLGKVGTRLGEGETSFHFLHYIEHPPTIRHEYFTDHEKVTNMSKDA
jgi:hypothetical protein